MAEEEAVELVQEARRAPMVLEEALTPEQHLYVGLEDASSTHELSPQGAPTSGAESGPGWSLDEPQRLQPQLDPRAGKRRLGFLCIAAVVVIWVMSSFLVQSIEDDLSAPFFLTYMSTNMFVILLPAAYMTGSWQRVMDNDKALREGCGEGDAKLASMAHIVRSACIIAPFWFLANFSYNLGLHYTSVTSSTILSGTSVVFTLFLGALLRLERVTSPKLVGVACCVWGTVMVGFADGDGQAAGEARKPVLGDLASLLGAVFYACYTLLIDKRFPGGDDSVDMALLFGFIGLANCLGLGLIVPVLHLTGAENLAPLSWSILGWIAVNGFFNNVCSDYLFARAVLLTSPTVTSVGISLTIPLATLMDVVIHQAMPPLKTLSGATLVVLGFLTVSLAKPAKPVARDPPPPPPDASAN